MQEVEIEALRPFNRHAQGDLCEPGDRFTVSESRAGELERLGLARRTVLTAPEAAAKAAPAPENKAAPEPANKVRQEATKPAGQA